MKKGRTRRKPRETASVCYRKKKIGGKGKGKLKKINKEKMQKKTPSAIWG